MLVTMTWKASSRPLFARFWVNTSLCVNGDEFLVTFHETIEFRLKGLWKINLVL